MASGAGPGPAVALDGGGLLRSQICTPAAGMVAGQCLRVIVPLRGEVVQFKGRAQLRRPRQGGTKVPILLHRQHACSSDAQIQFHSVHPSHLPWGRVCPLWKVADGPVFNRRRPAIEPPIRYIIAPPFTRATAVKSVDPKNRKEASVHSGNVKDGYVGDFF